MIEPGLDEQKADWPWEEAKSLLAKGHEGRTHVPLLSGVNTSVHHARSGLVKQHWVGTVMMSTKGPCLHPGVWYAEKRPR